jgi:hypothetical protein
MRRATTLIIGAMALLGGLAPLTAAPCSVASGFVCGETIFFQLSHFLVIVSDTVDEATLNASDFTVNGIPADDVVLVNGFDTIDFIFNIPPAVPGINTVHIPAGAFNCVTNGPVLEFTCTFGYRPIPLRPRPTPHPRPIPPE